MTKTARDICDQALRSLGVVASGSDMTAEEFKDAETALNAMFAELNDKEGFGFTWELSATPDWAFLPLSQMLSVEVAPQYELPPPRNQWWWGMQRLRRHAFPDDREDPADLDDDGTVSDGEAATYKAARFY